MKHVNVVCAIIENDKGEIFCCKRGPGRALEGYWEFPGGKIEIGETKEETVVREVREELDSIIEPIEYVGSTNYTYQDTKEYKGFSINLYCYRCRLVSGNLTLSEHTEAKWAKKSELNKLNFAKADAPIIEKIVKEW